MVPLSSAVARVATDWPDPSCPLASELHGIVRVCTSARETSCRARRSVSSSHPIATSATTTARTNATCPPPNRRPA